MGSTAFSTPRSRGAIPRKLRLPLWSVFAAALGGASIVHDDGVDFTFLEPAALAIALFVLLPGAAAALVVLLVERWMRVEPWSDRRLSIGLCIGAVAGTFALGLAGLVAAGALVVRRAGLDSLLARVARLAVPAALVVVTRRCLLASSRASLRGSSADEGSRARARESLGVRAALEDRLQRGVERLTLVRAVRMVATVALSLAVVAAVLELIVDSGINGFGNALWWAIVTVTTVGYGDVVPETPSGRSIACRALMLVGVSAIPITTSLVVSVFITRLQAKQRAEDAAERARARRPSRADRASARCAGTESGR